MTLLHDRRVLEVILKKQNYKILILYNCFISLCVLKDWIGDQKIMLYKVQNNNRKGNQALKDDIKTIPSKLCKYLILNFGTFLEEFFSGQFSWKHFGGKVVEKFSEKLLVEKIW